MMLRFFLRWSLGLLVLLLNSQDVMAQAAKQEASRLLLTEAELRAKQLSDVHYDLAVELSESDKPFSGQVLLDFKFRAQGQPLRIDFSKGEVQTVKVNGAQADYTYDGHALLLQEGLFKDQANNQILIQYRHSYSRDGNGLYRFVDPIDQQVYLYTHFEPYKANSFFPCFDQPDLKASYKLSVTAPARWTVVSAAREATVSVQGKQRLWTFPRTARFSTYLISLHAGPYKVWEDKSFRYPLRLMARQSLVQDMPADEWLATTRRGFDFFERSFGYAYPFQKYDQIAVPDFNAGAMENVAAVTFSEQRFLIRGHRTQAHKEALAHTLLHEMAHMWFGNLVTMRWWNDLWLNESFATYASTLAMAADPRFPKTWLGHSRSKVSAYTADELVTTHPIVAEIPHTDAALSNFDAITYGKGAAFLRQLNFVIGDAAFQKGLQQYFKQFAFQNTEVSDLIAAMEKSSGRSLQNFTKDWLQTAGPNTLSVAVQCTGDQLQQLNLLQSAPADYPTLREHKTKVALYKFAPRTGMNLIAQEAISYQGSRTEWKARAGLECPDLVFPNDEDYDYVKVKLDEPTLKLVRSQLHQLPQPQLRIMVWSAMFAMVESTEITVPEFLDFYQQQFPRESDFEVIRAIDAGLDRKLLPYIEMIADRKLRQSISRQLQAPYEKYLGESKVALDSKQSLFETYTRLLSLGEQGPALLELLQPGKSPFKLEQDQRWKLLQALSGLGHPQAVQLREKERQRDPSSQGRRQYLATQARFPDYKSKLQLIEPIVAQKSQLSAADRNSIINNLFPTGQDELKQQYRETYRKAVPEVVQGLELNVARSYVMSLLPLRCNNDEIPLVKQFLEAGYPDSIRKSLLVALQLNERCMKIMARLPAAEAEG